MKHTQLQICLRLALSCVGLWMACSRELPTEGISRNFIRGDIIVDTLEVAIIYDDTPGFLYPRMRHEINFSGHLTVSGFIDGYSYQSDDVGYGIIIDYIANYSPPPGTKFDHNEKIWSGELRQPGGSREFEFHASSPHANSVRVKSPTVVQRKDDGIRPEPNSRQLTGPEAHHSQPVFSQDGQWIYCQGYKNGLSGNVQTIIRVPARGGVPEILVESTESLGGFALTDNDTKLTFAIWKPHVKTGLVQFDLKTGTQDTVTVDGFLWSNALVPIPGTSLFVGLSDPNSAPDHSADLVLIDTALRTVETLVDLPQYEHVQHYGLRPGTRDISYGVSVGPYAVNVLLINLDTRQTTTFLNHLEAFDFDWALNGQDYVVTRYLQDQGTNIFLIQSGTERRITTYPGNDESPCFSPDGRGLAFAGSRRAETQIWRIEL